MHGVEVEDRVEEICGAVDLIRVGPFNIDLAWIVRGTAISTCGRYVHGECEALRYQYLDRACVGRTVSGYRMLQHTASRCSVLRYLVGWRRTTLTVECTAGAGLHSRFLLRSILAHPARERECFAL